MSSGPLVLRVLASAGRVAERAAELVRSVLRAGDLGIVIKAGEGATLGRTVWGLLGLGAFGYIPALVPVGKRIVTTTRSHSNSVVSACVDAMEPTDVLRVGGAGNKVLLLIEGKASAYVFASLGCKKWDTCAPEAILHAVGGKLTDMHGNSFEYHKEVKHMNSAGVLAALTDYDYYAARVPSATKAALKP